MTQVNISRWKQRAQIALCSVLGAFLIYCGQSVANDPQIIIGGDADMGSTSMIPDASAETAACLNVVNKFTKLETLRLFNDRDRKVTVDVGDYAEIVVYESARTCSFKNFEFLFSADGVAPFGYVGYGSNAKGALRVLGSKLEVSSPITQSCAQSEAEYVEVVIAGVSRVCGS